ncbi:unnamed protein product [Camellia sinensis]
MCSACMHLLGVPLGCVNVYQYVCMCVLSVRESCVLSVCVCSSGWVCRVCMCSVWVMSGVLSMNVSRVWCVSVRCRVCMPCVNGVCAWVVWCGV